MSASPNAFRRVVAALDRHWFAPASLRELAVVRIIAVGAQLFLFYPPLEQQLRLAAGDAAQYVPLPALKILLLPWGWGVRPDAMLLEGIWLLGIMAGVLAFLGVSTRLSLLAFAACNTALIAHGYSYQESHHPEALMTIVLWALALGPSGAALSVDDFRMRVGIAGRTLQFQPAAAREYQSQFARWPLRLAQWSFVLAYLSAGLSKLQLGGLAWFHPATLEYHILKDAFLHDMAAGLWLAQFPMVLAVLAVGTVIFELTFATAVVAPRLTLLYVAGGVGLHLGIFFTQHAPFFQYLFLYAVFIESLRRQVTRSAWWTRRRGKARGAWTLVYDGQCPLCIRSMVTIDYLDVTGRVRYVDFTTQWSDATRLVPGLTPAAAAAAIHLAGPDGSVRRGFHAFRALARVMPVFWPLVPALYLPGVAAVGDRVYEFIASNRSTTRCTPTQCSI